MSDCKTGAEHIASLRDGRTVYIDGERVADVTEHKAFRNAVRSAAALYDYQARPENIEAMTFLPKGAPRRVNRGWQMPRSHAEMAERRKALQAWAALSGGFLGRAPDHLSSSLIGQRMGIDVFRRHGEARAKAFADYVDYARKADLYLSYVIVNPQADRGKAWGEQEEGLVARIVDEDARGMTIRGAKMLGTATMMANEVFVANLQPLKPGEEDLAFCCALPMNAKGLRVLSRKSYEADAVSLFDNPISSRFDENDALMYFDDVKVPWERVFVYRDTDMCRAQFHDTPGHVYQNYQAQIRLSVKLAFLAGVARRITEAIGTTKIPSVAEQLGVIAAQVGMVNAMLSGMEASGVAFKEWWLPNKHFMYSAQVIAQDLYPRLVGAIRDLAGGALIMLPSSVRDLANPEMRAIIDKTQRASAMDPEHKVKVLKAAWDAIGSEFGSRHTQYEMFYAGARFVTAGHSFRTFDWNGATALVEALLASYDTRQCARRLERAVTEGRWMTDGGKLELFTLLGDYPCTRALKSGELTSDLVGFSFPDIKVANTGFKPLVRESKFDVSELAIVTYLQAKAYGKPYVLLPAVIVARGQHHTIAYNPARGPLAPADLAGKRVGIRAYTVTTATWVRGILAEQYGVDLAAVKWVTFEDAHLAEYADPAFVERAAAGKTIPQMLLDGELDAAVVGDKLPDPRLAYLIPDRERAAAAWAGTHGDPVNHMLVVRTALSSGRPDIVREVFRLAKESRDAAVRAGDKNAAGLQYGVEPNRRSLDSIIDIAFDQRIIPRRFSVDELFDETTHTLV